MNHTPTTTPSRLAVNYNHHQPPLPPPPPSREPEFNYRMQPPNNYEDEEEDLSYPAKGYPYPQLNAHRPIKQGTYTNYEYKTSPPEMFSEIERFLKKAVFRDSNRPERWEGARIDKYFGGGKITMIMNIDRRL